MINISKTHYKIISIVLFHFFILTGLLLSSCGDNNKYLMEVDRAIEMSDRHIAQKEHLINELKLQYNGTSDKEKQYDTLMDIYQNYQYFSLDSAFVYLEKALDLSMELGDSVRITDTRISLAFLYNFSGMLTESMEIFKSIQVMTLPSEIKRNYYYLGFNLYNSLAQNAINSQKITQLERLKKCYRDSALSYCSNDIILAAEKMNDNGEQNKAIALLSRNLTDNLTTDEAGLRYYVLSNIYESKNDINSQIKYLAMSSVASINNGVRQYIALRKLAEILYATGDIDRAYKYIHQCLNDAKACNSHSRILEASTILPIIDSAVLLQKQNGRNRLIIALAIITLLSLSLLAMLLMLHKKNIALNRSRQEQVDTNSQLKLVNGQLKEANEKLTTLNDELISTQNEQKNLNIQLQESNKVKTEYITRFMHLCLEYISKMENYRKTLSKVANKRNFDLLYETIQSSRYINKEVSTFYDNFDEAFLHIYPNFINDINKLFQTDEQIHLKDESKLTTELRICALMKLGITDGSKIQEFLRCSASTVYNYRTNLRNKAIDRDGFEKEVQKM